MATATMEKKMVRPVCSIREENDAVMLELEMPGVAKDGVEINIDGDTLSIHGRRPEQNSEARYLVRERHTGDYKAVYTIDERVDREKVEAHMEHGILTVTLHLKEEVKPRKIEVKAK